MDSIPVRNGILSVQYSAFDSERYALTYDNKAVRDVASAVPYDCMVILMNECTYGGGGIYNLYTTVAADNTFSEYIMAHEFGHHLAALADEYYTSSIAYEVPKIIKEPWETNITTILDSNQLKWKDMVNEDTPYQLPETRKSLTTLATIIKIGLIKGDWKSPHPFHTSLPFCLLSSAFCLPYPPRRLD